MSSGRRWAMNGQADGVRHRAEQLAEGPARSTGRPAGRTTLANALMQLLDGRHERLKLRQAAVLLGAEPSQRLLHAGLLLLEGRDQRLVLSAASAPGGDLRRLPLLLGVTGRKLGPGAFQLVGEPPDLLGLGVAGGAQLQFQRLLVVELRLQGAP
jgi:hypothetical protein